MILDYSYARPDPAAMYAAGVVAVMRYLSPTPSKNLSARERDGLHAAGLGIGLVWESVASRAGQGYAAGQADARAAEGQADALGYPAGCPIFYAVDYAATPAQVAPYFQGVASVAHRPVGVYGSASIVEGVPVPWKWQTSAWSAGRVSPVAHLYQRVVTPPVPGTDVNDPRLPFPLWFAGGVVATSNGQAIGGAVAPAPGVPHISPLTAAPQEDIKMLVIRDQDNGSIALIGELYCGEFGGNDMAGVANAIALWGDMQADGSRQCRNVPGAVYADVVSRARSRMQAAAAAPPPASPAPATVDLTGVLAAVADLKGALAGLTLKAQA